MEKHPRDFSVIRYLCSDEKKNMRIMLFVDGFSKWKIQKPHISLCFFFVQSELPQENSGICHSVGKRNEETPVDENFSTISDLWRKTEKEKL